MTPCQMCLRAVQRLTYCDDCMRYVRGLYFSGAREYVRCLFQLADHYAIFRANGGRPTPLQRGV